MIRCVLVKPDGELVKGDRELLNQWSPQTNEKIWVDIFEVDSHEAEQLLLELNCHPLAIQDALRTRHPPKVEFFSDQTFILYRGLYKVDADLTLEHSQIALFAGKNILITRHDRTSFAIEHWWDNEQLVDHFETPLLLASRIVNRSFTLYLDAVIAFEQELAECEDAMQESPDDELMRLLTQHKARLRRLLRTFNYHEKLSSELLEHAEKNDLNKGAQIIHHLQDLHERADRISSLLSMYYEICGDLIEGYISITSHKLNKTMQILTVVTTLFVPLGFLAGVYGMNFENMPELRNPYSYFILLGLMFTIATGTLLIFKTKRWL